MLNLRKYGAPPYEIAVIHGGPGAPGEMAPVARELAARARPRRGVLEPLQTAASVLGQIEELQTVLEKSARLPIVLLGHSWGAWLSYLLAARHPGQVKKLILVGSGPFTEAYVPAINALRFSRLSDAENRQVKKWLAALEDPALENRDEILRRFGRLMTKIDTYCPIPRHAGKNDAAVTVQAAVFQNVLSEAMALRQSGELLRLGAGIQCPVLAIHGDYDPHPFAGVQEPLSQVIRDFRFILLRHCGHTPWKELYAREKFYQLLCEEV